VETYVKAMKFEPMAHLKGPHFNYNNNGYSMPTIQGRQSHPPQMPWMSMPQAPKTTN
jgi:hypothetical protein